ncbi:MAG: hypothetical protein LC721_02645, partial [Actinobacteria bacterium]|nr:hypothetical protein [Actinomycetota bacterium]
PGPINRQGLLSVYAVKYDTCQPPVGKHFPAVFSGEAQTLDVLGTTPRLSSAWVVATVPMTDAVSGRRLEATIDVRWDLVDLSHDPSHIHLRVADDGVANSHDNDWFGAAVAHGSLSVAGETWTLGPSSDARISEVKAGCQVIVSPHATLDELACT